MVSTEYSNTDQQVKDLLNQIIRSHSNLPKIWCQFCNQSHLKPPTWSHSFTQPQAGVLKNDK